MAKQREIVISQERFAAMRQHLLSNPRLEQLGFILAGVSRGPDYIRLLAREFIPVPTEGLIHQTGTYLEAKPGFVQSVLRRCRDEGLSLVEIHSHPFSDRDVTLSPTDIESEWEKFPYIAAKLPGIYHATLVLGQRSVDGHIWSREEQYILPVTGVRIIGCPLETMPTTGWQPVHRALSRWSGGNLLGTEVKDPQGTRFVRQVMAFGTQGQARLAQAQVAIVGLSGIGSHVAQQLAYLGVRRFILIDPDVVTLTNLNRLVGARSGDIGRPKVEVMAAMVRGIAPEAEVLSYASSVAEPEVLSILKAADLLVGCTDTQHSRLVLNTLASRYLIPYIDCGAGIESDGRGGVSAMGGQVRLVMPDLPCLECIDGIDKQQAQMEFLTPEEHQLWAEHGYGLRSDAPAPSVVYLNGVVGSLAAGECFNLFTGYRKPHPYLFHDHLRGEIKVIGSHKRRTCIACGEGSPVALGDLEPLRFRMQAVDVPSAQTGSEGGCHGTAGPI